jgi:hypothetical protein
MSEIKVNNFPKAFAALRRVLVYKTTLDFLNFDKILMEFKLRDVLKASIQHISLHTKDCLLAQDNQNLAVGQAILMTTCLKV